MLADAGQDFDTSTLPSIVIFRTLLLDTLGNYFPLESSSDCVVKNGAIAISFSCTEVLVKRGEDTQEPVRIAVHRWPFLPLFILASTSEKVF